MTIVKKTSAIILVIIMLTGVFAVPVFAETYEGKEIYDIGYMTINSDGTTEYYIDGVLQRQRSKTTTYGEYTIEHESWKETLNENFRGCSWSDMWFTEMPFRYIRHYSRVKAHSGNGVQSDSGRQWVPDGTKRAEAQTAYIYYTITSRIESWWGYIDD